MTLATVTSKGQTTIPKKFRDSLKLRSREQITFELCGDALIIRRAAGSIDELAGGLKSEVPYAGKAEERRAIAAMLAARHENRS